MSLDRTNSWGEQSDENYYVSITDMMIGLIFFFLVLLMYFATQLRDTTEDIADAEQARDELIYQVAAYVRAEGVAVTVDRSAGVLRFPNEVLFARNSNALADNSSRTLEVLADALAHYVPCYSYGAPQDARTHCKPTLHHVDAIFVEGHTDSTPIIRALKSTGPDGTDVEIADNWGLSASRASAVFQSLMAKRPDLASLYNAPVGRFNSRRLFGIAGYADQRPMIVGEDEHSQAMNRRVELRFVMGLPTSAELEGTTPPVDRSSNPPPSPISVGQRLSFSIENSTDDYLRDGWSWREDWGVWTVGEEAVLLLPVADGDPLRPYDIVLQLVAYVPTGSPRRDVDVTLNGYAAGRWQFEGPKNTYTQTIRAPVGSVRPGQALRFQFSINNPVSPKRLTNPNDNRALGIGLVWAEVRTAE